MPNEISPEDEDANPKQRWAHPRGRELGDMAELEIRSMVEMAKSNIKQFYDMYDRKIKSKMTHPLFRSIDEQDPNSKLQLLTEQIELLETEMAKRVRDLVWAQSLLKKDQIVTKKRLADTVSDKQLEITMSSMRAHVQDQLSQFRGDMMELKALINNQPFEIGTKVMNQVKNMNKSQQFQNNSRIPTDSDPVKQGKQDKKNKDKPFGISETIGSMPIFDSDDRNYQQISGVSMAQSKAEIYDFLNLKLSEIHETYSIKVEMLANFMLQA